MYSNAYVWSRVLSYLEQHSPSAAVMSYFDDADIVELNEEKLVIYSPSPFRKDVITSRYTELIKEAMRDQFQTEIELVVLDEEEFPQYSLNKKRRTFVEFNSDYMPTVVRMVSDVLPLTLSVDRVALVDSLTGQIWPLPHIP